MPGGIGSKHAKCTLTLLLLLLFLVLLHLPLSTLLPLFTHPLPAQVTAAGVLRIGDAEAEVRVPENAALVPDVVFFDIPKHVVILSQVGARVVLLVGQY